MSGVLFFFNVQFAAPMMAGRLKAVLFDFDGTLTEPGSLDFAAIRQVLQCPIGQPVLEHIATLPIGPAREAAMRVLERFEAQAAEASRPNRGTEELILFLKGLGIPMGILTRNSPESVRTAFRNFRHIGESDFAVIITRSDPTPPKPKPDGVHLAARKMSVPAANLLVVGDYVFDIDAGQKAGALTVFLDNGGATRYPVPPADYTIRTLEALPDIIRTLMTEPE